MKIFADRLKELRQEHNLTQIDLAKELHVSDIAISRWERCERIPNIIVLRDLVNYFKVSADYFLGFDD